MAYLEEMNLQLQNENFPGFLRLWEEYRTSTQIIAAEVIGILEGVKKSEYSALFGRYAEEALEFLDKLDDSKYLKDVLRLILDLQTTNSEALAKASLSYLEANYALDPLFKEKIRLIGLRSKDNFKGAIRNFELLSHMGKGKYIFHTGGWGSGEIIDISLIREQLSIEFENVLGVREISFQNAFSNLIPLENDHFFALRYGDPDKLEAEAKKDPVRILKMLIADMGRPLNAHEIKQEIFELVIPADDWAKWWQAARAKAKKDPMILVPVDLKHPFVLLKKEISYEDEFKDLLEQHFDVEVFLNETFEFLKQHVEVLKKTDLKAQFREKLLKHLSSLEEGQDLVKIEIYLFLEEFFQDHLDQALIKIIKDSSDIEFYIKSIRFSPLKKKLLSLVRQSRPDWETIFANLFLTIPQHFLREYSFKELLGVKKSSIAKNTLQKLIDHPVRFPECFIWYFQKIQTDDGLPFADDQGRNLFFEALFILLFHIENDPELTDLTKKVHGLIINKHFQLFRDNIALTSIEFAREILLLVTKCQIFNHHDFKVFSSLTKVVHPHIETGDGKVHQDEEDQYIWTTQEGYTKVQERIQQIATVETVENAKEIEIARSYGDLRENSEFKFAQEKRARLQSEMKLLSSQLQQARILSPEDVDSKSIGVGTVVSLENNQGKKVLYTILGPWDADPEKGILSFQSQLAKAMIGRKVNESFHFRNDSYRVRQIKSYFE
jgi:transcription elongation factor GreA-like protein/transcription elongation GreA/GreB family factor